MNREEWLNAAVGMLNHLIATETDLTPSNRIQISVGWPRGGDLGGRVQAQCYPAAHGYHNIYVSPTLGTARQVLPAILHELIHAALDCTVPTHGSEFRKAWQALGFVGHATDSLPGHQLRGKLLKIAMELPEYPHHRLDPGANLIKKQPTRMIKVRCAQGSGYQLRMVRKWLDDPGPPICPCHNIQMEEAK